MIKNIKYFDIHSHLHSDFFKGDLKQTLEKMKEKKVWTISVGVNYNDSKKAVMLALNNKNIFATIGIHPTEKEKFNEIKFQNLLNNNKKKIVGIGECGLDYYWPNQDLKNNKINKIDFATELSRQKNLFIQQINFAIKNNLPMMLHIRAYKNSDAYFDAFKILKKYKNTELKVNFHFFTESTKIINKILNLNNSWTCSLPGVITFADLNKSIKNLPLKNMMSETDSPFATPSPYRGKINTPLRVKEIVKKIAEIKNFEIKETNKQLIKNALKFWNINF